VPVDVRDYVVNPGITPWTFVAPQVCELRVPGSRLIQVTYSGTAVATAAGQANGWRRAIIGFQIPTVNGRKWTPRRDRGAGWTFVAQTPPFEPLANSAAVGIPAALFNRSTAVNAGWAVDAAWAEVAEGNREFLQDDFLLFRALIAVSDVDGYLYRISYSVTLTGEEM